MLHRRSVSDKTIIKKVFQRLAMGSLGPHSRVTVAVRRGQVTLSGSIQYEDQRHPALKSASGVDGVRGVLDQLQVQSRYALGR